MTDHFDFLHVVEASTEVSAHFATMCSILSIIVSGPTVHWIGLKTLMCLWVEGRKVDALANSGSQVNTMTPNYVCQYEFSVLLLHNLVDHPLNLVDLGGTRTRPLSFMILRVQVKEITG